MSALELTNSSNNVNQDSQRFDKIPTPRFDRIMLPNIKSLQATSVFLPEDGVYNEELDALDALSNLGESRPAWETMNIRKILADNAIKDMILEEDMKFFNTVNRVINQTSTPDPDYDEELDALKSLSKLGDGSDRHLCGFTVYETLGAAIGHTEALSKVEF